MSTRRPFVVLPFPQRRQAVVSTRETTRTTDGRIVEAVARPVVKRDRTIRFFQDISGFVQSGPHTAPQFVACASGCGVPADQIVR
jgi:hypothetical protein